MPNTASSKPQVGLLVIDLDNTLWDWVDVWVRSFSALLDAVVKDTGLSPETIKSEMRAVHRSRGTTEYSMLLDELPSLKPFLENKPVRERFRDAIQAQRAIRDETKLYPGVLPTLVNLKARGVTIVAYTESIAYWTEWRIRHTGLDGIVDVLYSSPDSDFPSGVTKKQLRKLPPSHYGLKRTLHKHVNRGIIKPDPRILQEIVSEYGVGKRGIAYVGDSVLKDITMAQSVGVYDVHAEYGVAHKRPEYVLLQEVTHWTDEMVAREQETRPGILPTPTYVLKDGISELLALFDFGPKLNVDAHVELWKKTIDVQQHFNDIGWRIRALALTVLTFTLGAVGFVYVNTGALNINGWSLSPAAVVPIFGAGLWIAFWFADRGWFHKLLIGSVREGADLERLLRASGISTNLGGYITAESPIRFHKWRSHADKLAKTPRVQRLFRQEPMQWHSSTKLNIFYGIGLILLALAAVGIILLGPHAIHTEVPAPAPTVNNNITVEPGPTVTVLITPSPVP